MCIPGAAQHEVVRCRTGTFARASLWRSRTSGAPLTRCAASGTSDHMLDLFPSREAGLFGRRLKRERGARIPVTVVTGFLGAGKTTLIRRFLESPEGQGTAVIVNEFGAVGIDDALVRDSAEQTVLLGNGCVCCITRSDLQLALRQLLIDRERGLVPGFARIVIETSGLADPGPILQTFSTDRALGGEFHIDVLLTVVDAVSGETNLKTAAEARKQVILADRLVMSKSDLAGAAAVELLIRRLQELNPRAAIDVAVAGALAADRLIAPATVERSGFIAEAEHSDGIASFVLERQKPMQWPAFTRAMETLIALRGADLLRVKGILNVAGCQGPVVVQYVQHLAHPPVELQSWPDQNRNGRIVFITRNIAESQVRDLFAAVEMLASGE
jgi:G3E family GTPase